MSRGRGAQERIAFFVTPHGYGHAARACAVMGAIHHVRPEIEFEVYTSLGCGIFEESLSGPYVLHDCLTDVGLVQVDPFRADLAETVKALDRLYPLDPVLIEALAARVRDRRCRLVLCDISPMGIAVAARAGVPSVLVENFTWDWIYASFAGKRPGLKRHIDTLRGIYAMADHRLQAQPVCWRRSEGHLTLPVSRKPKCAPQTVRKTLGIPEGAALVLITTGGISGKSIAFLDKLKDFGKTFFVLAGVVDGPRVRGNLILLPRHSGIYHPDLVQAADAVVGKAGYSTLAEVYYAGAPFGFVASDSFREARVLGAYIEKHMSGLSIREEDFSEGGWLASLPGILRLPRRKPGGETGAEQAARFILDLVS